MLCVFPIIIILMRQPPALRAVMLAKMAHHRGCCCCNRISPSDPSSSGQTDTGDGPIPRRGQCPADGQHCPGYKPAHVIPSSPYTSGVNELVYYAVAIQSHHQRTPSAAASALLHNNLIRSYYYTARNDDATDGWAFLRALHTLIAQSDFCATSFFLFVSWKTDGRTDGDETKRVNGWFIQPTKNVATLFFC